MHYPELHLVCSDDEMTSFIRIVDTDPFVLPNDCTIIPIAKSTNGINLLINLMEDFNNNYYESFEDGYDEGLMDAENEY